MSTSFDISQKTCEICKKVATGAIPDETVEPMKIHFSCPDHYMSIYTMIEGKKK